MNKTFLAIVCLAVPIAALSADAKSPDGKRPPQPPAAAASAAAPAASQIDSRAAVRASQDRSRLLGVCRAKAEDQQIGNIERRQFMASCMAGK